MTRRVVSGALLLGLGAAGLAGCGGDPPASAGDVVAAAAPTSGAAGSVLLPTGQVDVVVGSPVGDLADDETAQLHGRRAPDGGSFVPVSWTFHLGDAPWGEQLAAEPKPAELSLHIGAASYDLGSAYHLGGDAIGSAEHPDVYVAVPSRPDASEVSVGVEYDGVTQTVSADGTRDPGRAAAIYDLSKASPPSAACPSGGWRSSDPTVSVTMQCTLATAATTPYFPGYGWAPDGQEWVVARASVTLSEADRGTGARPTTYRVSAAHDHSTLGGTHPAGALQALTAAGPAGVAGTLVFSVPAGTSAPLHLDVGLDLTVDRPGSAPAPDDLSVDVSRDVDLHLS